MGDQPPTDPTSPAFVPVCAIGASAGGVAALQTLFRLLPDDLGLAYVVVVHLSPDHPSAMHEILAAATRMPVHQVENGPALRPDCVYVIAPDRELVIAGDNVQCRPFTDPRGRRAPIDMFFRSVAAGRGDGIAVVLTGAGSDGALGVRAIKEAGGIVMVQEPVEAGFASMPQNAIATGVADVVAPLAGLAARIADAARSNEAVRSLDENGAANDIRRIVAFLRTRTGHDFSGYKRSTVLRRIQRRMQLCQIASPADYAQYVRTNPEEAKDLLSDLLISVTIFFRDPETFIALSHRVVRPMLEARSTGDTEDELRAWVVGCATGEEAYSLAILLLEMAEELKVNIPIQIFATDLDEGALATAREGRYPRSIEADVSVERLTRFFVDEGTHYRIDRRVRDLILFATHSVVREPPFMRLDLISCRNVLIYLEKALQRHVHTIFRYGLKPDGYLFLGTAETADTSDNLFAVVDREARIYRALSDRPDFVPTLTVPGPWIPGRPALGESRPAAVRFDAGEVLGESHAAALEASAPPSALVDAEQNVLHLSPTAGRFILLSAGPLSGRLASIVRPELRLDLKLALDRAFEAQQPTVTRPIDVRMDGDTRRALLHVTPLPAAQGVGRRALVYFLDSGPGQADGADDHAPPPSELLHLHSELKVAQEAELAGRLRHESAVQELRASNEELQSLNEEYRSTAEELETSKEELQSINEELQTVNAELKSKLVIISAAHNDLQNLTASSEIGTLFLDAELRIRMFTPPVAEVINVTEADVGRPITNFTHRLNYHGIEQDVRRTLRDLAASEQEVQTLDGRWFMLRVRPYRTLEGKVEGAVITFDDISERARTKRALADELRTMTRLHNLAERLLSISDLSAGVSAVLDAALDVYGSVQGTLQIHDPELDVLRYVASRGFDAERLASIPPIDRDFHSTCAVAIKTGRPVVAGDIASDPRWADHAPTAAALGYRAAVSSPMKTRGEGLLGVLTVHFNEPLAPETSELPWLDLFARMAANLVERARAEAALRESETRYRTMFQSMNEGYLLADVIVDPQGRPVDFEYLEANPAATRMMGTDVTGRRLRAVDPDYEEHWYEIFGNVALTGESVQAVRYAKPDDLWYDFNVTKVEPADPDSRRIAIRFFDATARVRAEQALRESEQLRRIALEGGRMGTWRWDLREELIWGDAVFLELWGVPPSDEAQQLADFTRRMSVTGQTEMSAMVTRAVNAGEDFDGQLEVTDGPTKGRWVRWRGRAEQDRPWIVNGVSFDVTDQRLAEAALRESEERQRLMLELVPALLWEADPAGGEIHVTDQWAAYTGQRADLVGNFDWLDAIHPDDLPATQAAFKHAFATGELVERQQRIKKAGNGYYWHLVRHVPVRDASGAIARWFGAAIDVHELHELQERQQVMVAELQHRTRNLIAVVRSIAQQTMAETGPTEAFQTQFNDRLSALSRVQGLLSRAGEDRITIDQLVRMELDALGAKEAGDRIVLHGPEARLRNSVVQTLALAIHELATNARKYGSLATESGTLKVTWAVRHADGSGRRLALEWVEQGIDRQRDAQSPTTGGYGRQLIERALPYALSAETSYELDDQGVRCTIDLPLDKPKGSRD